jgi:hypothetical protein
MVSSIENFGFNLKDNQYLTARLPRDFLGGEAVEHDNKQHEMLETELTNFLDIAQQIKPHPGLIPRINNTEIAGGILPLNSVVGGDHLIYIDFNERYDLDALAAKARADGRDGLADTLLHPHLLLIDVLQRVAKPDI